MKRTRLLALAGLLLLSACVPAGATVGGARVRMWRSSWTVESAASDTFDLVARPVAEGLTRPVAIEHAGDGTNRLFIVQQDGTIVTVKNGRVSDEVFLDLTEQVACCSEQGLLGFAAHPNYAENGLFFVYYTETSGDSVLARYQVSDDPERADAASAKTILRIPQPGATHNAGQLKFGPDGYLYVSVGDGGFNVFPQPYAQDLDRLLGKVLRIDVDRADPYGVPADNPFVSVEGARGEIWLSGLRNPWRFSFDRATGNLYIGDVGQSQWEEVNVSLAGRGGANYGWPHMEGPECFPDCSKVQGVLPALYYAHDEGCSVVGGYVYRGQALPHLQGAYLYADFCSGKLWGAAAQANEQTGEPEWAYTELLDTSLNISTFGEDESGEMYLADYGLGTLYQLVSKAPLAEQP